MRAEKVKDQHLAGETLTVFIVKDELFFPVDQYCYKFELSLLKQIISIQANEDISSMLVKNVVCDKTGNTYYSGFLLPGPSFLLWLFQIAEKSKKHREAKLELSVSIASIILKETFSSTGLDNKG